MYDLARLRGVLGAVGAVILALGIGSAVANLGAGGRPAWLSRGDSTIEGGQERIVGGRIVGAARAVTQQAGQPDNLGVILGASAVGMGIDPTVLEAEAGPKMPGRWLSLYANGANVADIRDLAELLFMSNLHPRLLVLGLHPGLLARSDDYLTDRRDLDTTAVRKEMAARHILGTKQELQVLSAVPLNWAFPNRTRISNLIRGLASATKRRLFARLGMGAEDLYAADANPWRVRLLVEDAAEPDREAAAEGRTASVRDAEEGPMREGLNGPVKDKGWFIPNAYAVAGDNTRALISLIRAARDRQIEVVLVLLPEVSTLRANVPPEAMTVLHTALDQAFGPAAPLVLDLRATLADRQFHDSVHPNKSGRDTLTRRLTTDLQSRKPPG